MKKYNKNKSYYIHEKEVIDLVKLILLEQNSIKTILKILLKKTWIYLINDFTNNYTFLKMYFKIYM